MTIAGDHHGQHLRQVVGRRAGSWRRRPPNFLPMKSNSTAASSSPSSVGTTTIATIIAIELPNDAQNTASPSSSI